MESVGETAGARSNMGLRARQPGIPAKFIVLALVAVLVIPGTIFASVLLFRYAQAERSRYELQSINVANSAATVIDAELIGLQRTLQALSVSQFLAMDNFDGFYNQAMALKELIGADIGVRDLNGQQLANTHIAPGNKLPLTPFDEDKTVLETGKPVITDVFTGAVAQRPLVAIIVPVMRDGKVRYLLHISSDTERFYDAVKSVTPDGWVIGVGDRKGTYVTRSQNHKDFTGKPGVAAYVSRATTQDGTFLGESAFGDKVLVGFDHTRMTNWLVAANIRQSVIEGPLYTALYILGAFGAVALALASLIGLWLWRFISQPLAQLAQAGQSLAAAEPPPPLHTRLREFIAVHKALALAASQVRAGRRQLEDKVIERTHELQHANTELTEQMSAREKAESQLRQIQKMEAIGQLTGGIAHDFNNMLAIVISSLGLMKRRLERGDTNIEKFADSALDGARRAATLTSRLLAFARQQPLAPEILEVNRLVAGMSDLLQRTIGHSIKIETVLAAGLWRTNADSAQLENAILNLCVNARDAMPDGGRLTIETSNVFLDEEYSISEAGVTSGQYVQASVTDTGGGMEAEVVARAFDPFFTTKRLGMGTGLGLSQVYGFVKQSNGHVKIYSEPGAGTTIKVYLPRYYGKDAAGSVRAESRETATGSANEVILVVEDEENLRHLTVTTLRELGYTVIEASGAREALVMIDGHPEIKLLFTDIIMPEVTGRVLADEAVARRPDLRVLYTTGFTRNAVVHNGVLDAGVNFLPKPFSMESLGAKVREVLDAK